MAKEARAEIIHANFSHKNVPRIEYQPFYDSIHELCFLLNSNNAASVQNDLGDGRLGMLGLTVYDAEYRKLSLGSVTFTRLTHPKFPTIEDN